MVGDVVVFADADSVDSDFVEAAFRDADFVDSLISGDALAAGGGLRVFLQRRAVRLALAVRVEVVEGNALAGGFDVVGVGLGGALSAGVVDGVVDGQVAVADADGLFDVGVGAVRAEPALSFVAGEAFCTDALLVLPHFILGAPLLAGSSYPVVPVDALASSSLW